MRIGRPVVYVGMMLSSLVWGQSPAANAPGKPASVEGTVVNSQSGEPLKKAQVALAKIQGGDAPEAVTLTDSGGKFKIAGLAAGAYRVVVTRTGFVRPQTRRGDSSLEPSALTLVAEQEVTGLVYRLAPAAILAGRVVDEDGAAFPGVRISCVRPVYGRNGRQLVTAGMATSDDRGQYRIAGLNPGGYYLRASYTDMNMLVGGNRSGPAFGYATVYYPGVMDAGQAAEVPVREGEERDGVDFKLTPAPVVPVEGQVRTADGRPAGRDVVVSLAPRMAAGLSARAPIPLGNDGSFRFTGVTAGSYILTAYPPNGGGAESVRQPLEVGENPIENIRLVLRPPVQLKGILRAEGDGKVAFTGLRVVLQPRGDSTVLSGGQGLVPAGSDGTFVFHGVAEGDYAIAVDRMPDDCYVKAVRTGGRALASDEITVNEATAASGVELVVSTTGGRIDGALTDDQQRPQASVTVVLVPDSARRDRGDLYRTAATDQRGHFVLRGIPPGDYKLFAWDEDLEQGSWRDPAVMGRYEEQGKSVSVDEGSRNSIELQTIHAVQ